MRHPFLLLALAAGLVAGCGDKLSPVNGTVTYDGAPVEGASVIFMSESGSKQATARTDSSGKFSLEYNNGPGIPAGTYKVMVARAKALDGPAPLPAHEAAAGGGKVDKGYLEKMKAKDLPKGAELPAHMVGAKKAAKVDVGDLPAVYSSPSTTPLTITVPASGPVELKLEKKK